MINNQYELERRLLDLHPRLTQLRDRLTPLQVEAELLETERQSLPEGSELAQTQLTGEEIVSSDLESNTEEGIAQTNAKFEQAPEDNQSLENNSYSSSVF